MTTIEILIIVNFLLVVIIGIQTLNQERKIESVEEDLKQIITVNIASLNYFKAELDNVVKMNRESSNEK